MASIGLRYKTVYIRRLLRPYSTITPLQNVHQHIIQASSSYPIPSSGIVEIRKCTTLSVPVPPHRIFPATPITVRCHSSSPKPLSDLKTKSIPFLLADIGEGIAEIELLQWFVSPGDRVSQFDRVCEVQSDKATTDITSRYDGIVESLNGEAGDMISVGSPLMHIRVESDDGDDNDNACVTASEMNERETMSNLDPSGVEKLTVPSVASSFSIPERGNERKVLTSPAVRKLAKDHKIDLSSIIGTGPNHRILKGDLLKIINPNPNPNPNVKISFKVNPNPNILNNPNRANPNTSTTSPSQTRSLEIPIRGYNRLMVKTMTESLNIPHMTYCDEINLNQLIQTRQRLKPIAMTQKNTKLSYLPFAIKALSLSLLQYPTLNATFSLSNLSIQTIPHHNVGIAMDTPRGLAVPVIKNCQSLSLWEIASEISRLQTLASENALSSEDVSDGTISFSNIGAIGGTYMSPIVTPPQLVVGAMGMVRRVPRYLDEDTEEVSAVHVVNVSWGADHRVVDGGTLARFSNKWKEYMENPDVMMMEMK